MKSDALSFPLFLFHSLSLSPLFACFSFVGIVLSFFSFDLPFLFESERLSAVSVVERQESADDLTSTRALGLVTRSCALNSIRFSVDRGVQKKKESSLFFARFHSGLRVSLARLSLHLPLFLSLFLSLLFSALSLLSYFFYPIAFFGLHECIKQVEEVEQEKRGAKRKLHTSLSLSLLYSLGFFISIIIRRC